MNASIFVLVVLFGFIAATPIQLVHNDDDLPDSFDQFNAKVQELPDNAKRANLESLFEATGGSVAGEESDDLLEPVDELAKEDDVSDENAEVRPLFGDELIAPPEATKGELDVTGEDLREEAGMRAELSNDEILLEADAKTEQNTQQSGEDAKDNEKLAVILDEEILKVLDASDESEETLVDTNESRPDFNTFLKEDTEEKSAVVQSPEAWVPLDRYNTTEDAGQSRASFNPFVKVQSGVDDVIVQAPILAIQTRDNSSVSHDDEDEFNISSMSMTSDDEHDDETQETVSPFFPLFGAPLLNSVVESLQRLQHQVQHMYNSYGNFNASTIETLPNNYRNVTSTIKIVDGSLIQVNETINKEIINGVPHLFHLKVIALKPQNNTDNATTSLWPHIDNSTWLPVTGKDNNTWLPVPVTTSGDNSMVLVAEVKETSVKNESSSVEGSTHATSVAPEIAV